MSVLPLASWPQERDCPGCGARAVLLWSSIQKATYECRGTPENRHELYGPDRCGRTFVDASAVPCRTAREDLPRL